MDKQERIDIINNLIKFISKRGRRHFYSKGTLHDDNVHSTAYMRLLINGRLYFVDNYTKELVSVIKSGREWYGFSHGGTLQALILDFADFIRTGKYSNGKNGYEGLYSSDWGHSEEIQQEIINYAIEIGYLKGDSND